MTPRDPILTLTADHARQVMREWERATERHHELQVRVGLGLGSGSGSVLEGLDLFGSGLDLLG